MKRNQIIALSIGGAVAVLVIGGMVIAATGGGDDAAPAPTPAATTAPETTTPSSTTTSTTTTTTTTTTSTTTTVAPPATVLRQPLTGVPVEQKSDLIERAALVVKIDNHASARSNQNGLAVADVVFEEIVEGSLTRFAAVFHTNDSDPVGPIRSGRTQDVFLFESFNQPLFAWSGGNPGVTQAIAESSLTDLNWQTHAGDYYRGPGVAPHNLYSSTQRLWALTPSGHPGAPDQQYEYVEPGDEFEGERDVGRVDVQVGGIAVDWDWNEERGQFERSQRGAPHNDKTFGRIGATNVVVMGVEYKPSAVDARSPEAQTVGQGPLVVFSDGQLIEGTWWRPDVNRPIGFFDSNKESLLLTPGNTWIELAEVPGTPDPAQVVGDPGAEWGGIPMTVDSPS
jgi:hypothetical protein